MLWRLLRATVRAAGAGSLAYGSVIRPWQLRWGATDEEARRDLPGDELVPHPMLEATRAITIHAAPDRVWPWLVQMGYRRAGWYSYDRIDNAGIPSADRIIPELQDLEVGDIVPTDPKGGFTVTEIEPERHLVLSIPRAEAFGARGNAVTSIALDPVDAATTRLVCRLRADFERGLMSRIYYLLFEPGDFVMMRKMLQSIKERAERSAPVTAATA